MSAALQERQPLKITEVEEGWERRLYLATLDDDPGEAIISVSRTAVAADENAGARLLADCRAAVERYAGARVAHGEGFPAGSAPDLLPEGRVLEALRIAASKTRDKAASIPEVMAALNLAGTRNFGVVQARLERLRTRRLARKSHRKERGRPRLVYRPKS